MHHTPTRTLADKRNGRGFRGSRDAEKHARWLQEWLEKCCCAVDGGLSKRFDGSLMEGRSAQ